MRGPDPVSCDLIATSGRTEGRQDSVGWKKKDQASTSTTAMITITITTTTTRGPFLGALRGLVAPHSHDAKDSLDQALEGSRDGIRAVAISLVILVITAGIQAFVVVASGSVALLGDTLHNAADALTAVPLWLAFRLGRRAPTSRFTYGYGKAEDVAGVAVLALIFGSAAFAGYEAIDRLIHPQKITATRHCYGRGCDRRRGQRGGGPIPHPCRAAHRLGGIGG